MESISGRGEVGKGKGRAGISRGPPQDKLERGIFFWFPRKRVKFRTRETFKKIKRCLKVP